MQRARAGAGTRRPGEGGPRRRLSRRNGYRPAAALVLLAGLAALVPLAGAPRVARAWEAPLDTLETQDAPPPWVPREIQISRSILPEISGTELPAATPPARPPRLDDPLDAAWQFHLARRALAAGKADVALQKVREAGARDPARAAYPWWRTWHALQRWNLDFLSALPQAWGATHADPAAWKRLLLLGHAGAVLWVALLWTLVVAAFLFRWGGHLSHDLAALFLRDPAHAARPWALPALLLALALLRPGWLIALAALSGLLFVAASARARILLAGVWLLAAAAVYPNWPLLRAAMPAVDPASETVLLSRATSLPPSPALVQAVERRLAEARDDAPRTARLRLALAVLAARGGDYDASSRLFGAIVRQDPTNVAALVGAANNDYYLGRYDAAVRGYGQALQATPGRAEIHYNISQAYAKKLFFKESSEALARANALGFAPGPWEDRAGAANGFSPVIYLPHDREDLETSARWEAARYAPLAHLAAWSAWLGGTPGLLFWLLAGGLILAVAAGLWLPADRRSAACSNCCAPVCPRCATRRDDELLCVTCQGTAERARSELVLATLLKNRSRDQELAFIARAQRFNRILPGASGLVAGHPFSGLSRLSALATALLLMLFGWSFNVMAVWDLPGLLLPGETVHPLLWPLPAAAWNGPRTWSLAAGALLALGLYGSAWLGHESFRRGRPSRRPKQILKLAARSAAAPAAGGPRRDTAQGR